MATIVIGGSPGVLVPIVHAIVPAQALVAGFSGLPLGTNNYQTTMTPNQVRGGQPRDCQFAYATVAAWGAAPTAGTIALVFNGPSSPYTWTVTAANITLNTNSVSADNFLDFGALAQAQVKAAANSSITVSGSTGSWAQASTGGITVTLFAWEAG